MPPIFLLPGLHWYSLAGAGVLVALLGLHLRGPLPLLATPGQPASRRGVACCSDRSRADFWQASFC